MHFGRNLVAPFTFVGRDQAVWIARVPYLCEKRTTPIQRMRFVCRRWGCSGVSSTAPQCSAIDVQHAGAVCLVPASNVPCKVIRFWLRAQTPMGSGPHRLVGRPRVIFWSDPSDSVRERGRDAGIRSSMWHETRSITRSTRFPGSHVLSGAGVETGAHTGGVPGQQK